jgi:hypothetical protein
VKPRDLALILDVAACYRLTRLVTKDVLLVNWRDNMIRQAYKATDTPFNTGQVIAPGDWAVLAEGDPDAPKLAKLVTCRWCMSIWVAAGILAGRRVAPRSWDAVARMLTIASAGALIARIEK